MGCQTPQRVTGSQLPQDPREDRGGLHGKRNSKERIRASGCLASRCLSSCYPIEKPELSAETRQGLTLSFRYGTSPSNADLTFGRPRLMNTKHAPPQASKFPTHLINFSHLVKKQNSASLVPNRFAYSGLQKLQ